MLTAFVALPLVHFGKSISLKYWMDESHAGFLYHSQGGLAIPCLTLTWAIKEHPLFGVSEC